MFHRQVHVGFDRKVGLGVKQGVGNSSDMNSLRTIIGTAFGVVKRGQSVLRSYSLCVNWLFERSCTK